jgi:hypothetical protein
MGKRDAIGRMEALGGQAVRHRGGVMGFREAPPSAEVRNGLLDIIHARAGITP